jgi:hypothetical protein
MVALVSLSLNSFSILRRSLRISFFLFLGALPVIWLSMFNEVPKKWAPHFGSARKQLSPAPNYQPVLFAGEQQSPKRLKSLRTIFTESP